jgi:hypothetical protein
MAKYGIWEVSGSFIIPGARKKGTLSPIRVVAKDRFKASEDLAGVLNEKFRRDLKDGQYFTKHFAAMNLQWKDLSAKAQAVVQAIQANEQAAE